MPSRLSDFKVLTFDCYGTLIDWESGIWDALQPLLMKNHCDSISRNAALETFAKYESAHEFKTPSMLYPGILKLVHRDIAHHFSLITDIELDDAFSQSVQFWPAFSDTAEALRVLKKHYKLIILSNIDLQSFTSSNRKLGVEFDGIYTAQEIGSYKPSSSNFQFMIERIYRDFGFKKNEILHTAQSLFHDHVPAQQFGLTSAWIDRQLLADQGKWGATAPVKDCPKVAFRFTSMIEMANAVKNTV